MPSPNTISADLNLLIITTAQANWGNSANANFSALEALAPVSHLAVAANDVDTTYALSTSLKVKISAGTLIKSDGTLLSYAGVAGYLLTASVTSYLYLDDTGTLQVNTTGFPAAFHVRLAVVVTGATTITSITDSRLALESVGVNRSTLYLALAGGTFSDASAVVTVHTGTTHGVDFGGATTDLVGFHGATPIAQAASANQTAVGTLATVSLTDSTGGTASTTLAAATNTSSLTDSTGGTASTTLAAITDTATKNAVASLAAQLAIQLSLNTVLINAVSSLAAQVNHAVTDFGTFKTLVNELRSDLVNKGLIKGSA